MPLLPNINVGTAPNDGTGDTIRNAFIKVNENFQFIEAFFPNTDVANLTANITSTGTSTFNNINGSIIGNAGATLTGSIVNAATIGNAGALLVGNISTAAQPNITSLGTLSSLSLSGNLNGTNFIANTGIYGNIQTTNQPFITNLGNSATIGINSNIEITNGNLDFTSNYRRILASNLYLTGIGSHVSNVNILETASGNLISGFSALINLSYVSFHMTNNINLSLDGATISPGFNKTWWFKNNTGSTKYVLLWNDSNNKGTNSIAVANGTVTTMFLTATDSTAANIFVTIANN